MELVKEWTSDLRGTLGEARLVVETVRIGVFYTAVQISTGHVGVAFTPRDLTDSVCCPKTAASAPPSGRMTGQSAWELAGYASSAVPLRRAVGVAALNAVSALAMDRYDTPGGQLCPGLDALKAADVRPEDRVAMVGAFVPFIKALKGHVTSLSVIDKHPESLKPDEKCFWVPPERAAEPLRQSSMVICSGSALVEGDIDCLLEASSSARKIVLAGPTASPWPPPFFAHGIDVLGGIRVRDSERLLTLISEGGSGYLFEDAAEKVSIVRSAGSSSINRRIVS